MTLLLGPLLRHVTDTTATVWVETSSPCEVEVCGTRTRTFTVHGHHYALVVVAGLVPDSITPYEVHLDGVRHWPPLDTTLPPTVIRTTGDGTEQRIVFGSCRAAAPHEEPYTLELDHDDRGRGVDALWALAGRVALLPPEQWPTLLVMLGDQVYADDSSPRARERIEARRDDADLPPEIVADFEEYTWLYREAWSPEMERWLLSVVPSTMIFDDHDMVDDWNISASWVAEIRREPWWRAHILGGLCSYWIHQHLGNLSPSQIERQGMLAQMVAMPDATEFLERWALDSESDTPLPGGYEFSFVRELGDVRLVVIDVRNGRVLDGERRLVDAGEWTWIRECCLAPCRHLLIGSSLPAFVPGGLHGIQRWNETVCAGPPDRRRTQLGERLRRAIDLEDWPAFAVSFDELVDLLAEVVTPTAHRTPPRTVSVLSGDIHFAYVADVHLQRNGADVGTVVRQVVSSPMRNALATRERRVIRFGISRVGRWIGQRLVQRHPDRSKHHAVWEITDGPFFTNNLAELHLDGDDAELTLWGATDEAGVPATLARVELS